MRSEPDLIYCAGANPRLTQIAQDYGFLLGVRSDRNPYGFKIDFVDIEYKYPNFEKHLEIVKLHKPRYAVVPDLSETDVNEEDVARAIAQAEQLAPYCEFPLLVPKLSMQLDLIPASWPIAYSLPTSYGGARFGIWKTKGRRIHLLGGSPHEQMKLYRFARNLADIGSVDGNMSQKMAVKFAKFWQGGSWLAHPKRQTGTKDLYLDCWDRSCCNIRAAWQGQIAEDKEIA